MDSQEQTEACLKLLRALFDQARADIAANNGHAAEAWAFLRSPRLVVWLAKLGIDPQYYRQMLDGPGPDLDADLDRRIRGMERWGASRTEIVLALWGTISAVGYERVARVLGPKRGDK
ncbi:MAG: hypothetical protein ACYSVY_00280 [Planctomycetota bacterium]|jgi:hypothetical protein